MFRRAAYYDSQAQQAPFQAIKEGGNRNQPGMDTDGFRKMINGNGTFPDEGGPQEHKAKRKRSRSKSKPKKEEQLAGESSVHKSSQVTAEGQHLVNIGIVEINSNHQNSSQQQARTATSQTSTDKVLESTDFVVAGQQRHITQQSSAAILP